MQRIICCSIMVLAMLAGRAESQCCIFPKEHSLLDSVFEAEIVAIGRLQNAVEPNNALPDGQVELTLDDVIVPHAFIKGKKSIVISRHIEPSKSRYLFLMEIYKGKLDFYNSVILDGQGEMERFIRGAFLLKDKSPFGRAKFAVHFLVSSNPNVVKSAHVELGRVSYTEFHKIATGLKPDPWVKSLQGSNIPPAIIRGYALLLGHCGTKEHATMLRKLLDHFGQEQIYGVHDLLFAYVLLDRENGWRLVTKIIEEKALPFHLHYAALQTTRMLYEERKDVIDQTKCLAAIASILNVRDLTDFVVEDLRKWKRWEYCEVILKLPSRAGFNSTITCSSVLRFALQCPTPSAKTYVKAERVRDPEFVTFTEERLALEK